MSIRRKRKLKPKPQKIEQIEQKFLKVSEKQEVRKLVEEIVNFLDDKKMQNIIVMNLEIVNPYFGIFIIASANSYLQLGMVAKEFQKKFFDYMPEKNSKTQDAQSGWLIFDFVDVIVHLFMPEQRSYYNLEKLWGDSEIIYTSDTKQFQW
ncbi:MAG: ribosome silencing factor [Leptospiraceae bacterium]|nr:ribosome silencing factor [Leptospiraceae bacterium]MDW7976495.1 ribosome silencing factor [Leptospiraceae bacterium]